MKTLKRIGTLFAALALVLSMSMTAFGAVQLTNGKAGENYLSTNEGAIVNNTVTLKKELVVYNTNGEEIYLPNVEYTYTVTSAVVADRTTVTDGDDTPGPDTGVVYAGVMDAVTTTTKAPTVTYATTDEKVTASATGTKVTRTFDVTFDPSKFEHSGIYRYKITETNDGLETAGVYRDTNNYAGTDRYLDVYVRQDVNNENPDSGYVIYGYVLMNSNNASVTESDESNATKTDGWMATVGTDGACTDADIYNTYNLKVTKSIEGNLADKTHHFPFSAALTLPTAITKQVRIYTEGTSDDVTAEDEPFTKTYTFGSLTSASTIKLDHEAYVLIIGIPAETTVEVKEINDTYDVYTASQIEIKNGTSDPENVNTKNISANPTYATDLTSIFTVASIDNNTNDHNTNVITAGDVELTVKNEMAIVSPTGVVAGLVLLGVALKRRTKKDDDEK